MNKYSDEQKQEVIKRYANGESVSDIVSDYQILAVQSILG